MQMRLFVLNKNNKFISAWTYSAYYHINFLSSHPPGIYLPTLPPQKKRIQEGLVPEGFMMPLVSKAHVDRSDPWTKVSWRLFVVTLGKSWSKSDFLFFWGALQEIKKTFDGLSMMYPWFWGWFPSFEIPGCCFLWCWNLEHPIQAAEIQHVDSRCANFKIKSGHILGGGSSSPSLMRWVSNNNY